MNEGRKEGRKKGVNNMSETPKISLVMPVYKTEEFLSRAIESILDQDLQDWELICCMDGKSKKASNIINEFNDDRIKQITIKHGGACAARNAGAELATGKYISFFSSDFQAIPGMLRTWINELEKKNKKNDNCVFVYGGYKFTGGDAYQSEPFDARQLETYNYIDGGFPLDREVFNKYKWDVNIKSLNDWDFWLRIVKAGYKGHYIKDYYSYIAEPPRLGGLSHDSSSNWVERVKQVRDNNNVPQRKIVVSSLGASYFGRNAAKLLDADFITMPSFKPHEYKMVYLLGFYPDHADQHARVFANAPKGCKKVIHWVGTDIQQMKRLSWDSLTALTKALNDSMTIQFVESEERYNELKKIGLNVEILPVLRDISMFKEKPLPKDFAVGIYTPNSNSENYNIVLMENIVKNMPDVKFYFFGNRNIQSEVTNRNITNLGWCDINDVIDKCSLLLRYTIHDGLPTAPMEFMMSNRFVITNTTMPYAEIISGNKDIEGVRKEIIEKIRFIKEEVENGAKPDFKCRDYYVRKLNPNKIKKRLYSIIGNLS